MKYMDKIYDEFQIKELVLLDLINSPTLQRLKGVDQAGYFESYFPNSKLTRFEHSIGVYLLLKKYGASIEEQIAGLIHDVSHSTFSHCVDYLENTGSEKEQNHQDNVFADFVKKSDIPVILTRHGFDLNYILDDNNFPLKEKELPDLCADRIDYSLRTAINFGEIKVKDTNFILDNLKVINKNWIFKNFESAKKYANLFLKLNTKYYAGLPAGVMLKSVGNYLNHAILNNYISKDDLYTTDEIVLSKIEPHHQKDNQLQLLFDRMNNKISFTNSPENFDFDVFCKSRVVDPLCQCNGKVKRVSDIDKSWGEVIEKESKPKQYFVKFES